MNGPAPEPLWKKVVNGLSYNASWAACVFGAANGLPWLGPVVVTLTLAAHFAIFRAAAGREAVFILGATLFGTAMDSALARVGAVSYGPGAWSFAPWLAPAWLIFLWFSFASTINHLLGFMAPRPTLTALLGFVFGPLSYYAGHRFGAVTFNENLAYPFIAMALAWAIVLPGLALVGRRLLTRQSLAELCGCS